MVAPSNGEKGIYLKIKAISLVKSKLMPFDIMVEKTPFILTDYITPPSRHICPYIGTPEQLKDLDMDIQKSSSTMMISNQESRFRATRDGQVNHSGKVLNVDEVAILRREMTPKYSMSEGSIHCEIESLTTLISMLNQAMKLCAANLFISLII